MQSNPMNTNHTNENPPVGLASSSRKDPCYETDSTTAALAVLADETSYVLPYAHFLYAERRPNPALEQEPDAPPEEMRLHFAAAEVVLRGSGLRLLERAVQKYELKSVKAADRRLAATLHPHIAGVTLTLTKENI